MPSHSLWEQVLTVPCRAENMPATTDDLRSFRTLLLKGIFRLTERLENQRAELIDDNDLTIQEMYQYDGERGSYFQLKLRPSDEHATIVTVGLVDQARLYVDPLDIVSFDVERVRALAKSKSYVPPSTEHYMKFIGQEFRAEPSSSTLESILQFQLDNPYCYRFQTQLRPNRCLQVEVSETGVRALVETPQCEWNSIFGSGIADKGRRNDRLIVTLRNGIELSLTEAIEGHLEIADQQYSIMRIAHRHEPTKDEIALLSQRAVLARDWFRKGLLALPNDNAQ